jgi:hypothetical protein
VYACAALVMMHFGPNDQTICTVGPERAVDFHVFSQGWLAKDPSPAPFEEFYITVATYNYCLMLAAKSISPHKKF